MNRYINGSQSFLSTCEPPDSLFFSGPDRKSLPCRRADWPYLEQTDELPHSTVRQRHSK